MISMLDVANKAGVSKATVSRVLNQKGSVSSDIKNKVLMACEELNYKMNSNIQDLVLKSRNGSTRNIAFVMVNKDFSDPAYAEMIDHIAAVVNEKHYQLLLVKIRGDEESVFDIPPILRDSRIDGMLVAGKITSQTVDLIKKMNIPCEVVGNYKASLLKGLPSVGLDFYLPIYDIVEQMVANGCKRIAFVSEMPKSFFDQENLRIFKDVCEELSVEFDENINFKGEGAFSGIPSQLKDVILNGSLDFDGIYLCDIRLVVELSYFLGVKFGLNITDHVKTGCCFMYNYKLPIEVINHGDIKTNLLVKTAFKQLMLLIDSEDPIKRILI